MTTRDTVTRRALGLRNQIVAAENAAAMIARDPELAPVGKGTRIRGIADELEALAGQEIDALERLVRSTVVLPAETRLRRIVGTDTNARAAAAATLAPVMAAASTRPEALLGAYERHYADHAARALLEDVARQVVDLLPDDQAVDRFVTRWNATAARLIDTLPDDEATVRAEIADGLELLDFIDEHRPVLAADLVTIRAFDPTADTMIHALANPGHPGQMQARMSMWRISRFDMGEPVDAGQDYTRSARNTSAVAAPPYVAHRPLLMSGADGNVDSGFRRSPIVR